MATINPGASPAQPAAPPTRMEIERKLSFKSAAAPRPVDSKRARKPSLSSLAPSSLPAVSGNESDSSSVTSSVPTQSHLTSPQHPGSPMSSPILPSVGGLSSIAERAQRGSSMGIGELLDEEVELEDVDEEGEGDGGSDEDMGESVVPGGDLERGMEGERVVKSGYLWKKQERRKAWKKRWFVLRTVKLAYYKDDKEYSLCRLLDLHTVHTVAPVTVNKHPFSFGIVTSKRTFFAKASSQDEMEEWVRAINGVRRRLGEREEEERGRREKIESGVPGTPRGGMAIPHREVVGEQHQGTYTSTFSSVSTSPSRAGYFGTRTPTGQSPQVATSVPMSPIPSAGIPPPSPMGTTNTLTSQLAKASLSSQPLALNLSHPRRPSNPPISSPMINTGGRSLTSAQPTIRDPSTSSVSSDYFPKTPNLAGPNLSVQGSASYAPSSDEDEAYFSDPNSAFPAVSEGSKIGQGSPGQGPVDPNKVILSAYMMKRSKGRGRKVWRKRWFYLTSQGLTYTKSHMDSRALRYIPLTSILDAIDVASSDEGSSSDVPEKIASSFTHSPSFPTNLRRNPSHMSHDPSFPPPSAPHGTHNENTFRLITSKRTYVLCAPSEEDEIKWLAAFRALLNRERGGAGPMSPIPSTRGGGPGNGIPLITQQPPTPATIPPPTPASPTDSASPQLAPPILAPVASPEGGEAPSGSVGIGGRGRSATQSAKSAVADVVRRFHPEGSS